MTMLLLRHLGFLCFIVVEADYLTERLAQLIAESYDSQLVRIDCGVREIPSGYQWYGQLRMRL